MQKHNHTVEYVLQKLQGMTLSGEVKSRMRVELSAFADFHAGSIEVMPTVKRASGTIAWLTTAAWYRAGSALLAVLLLAGGTAYASEGALPGNALYTVKVNIKEPIEVAFAISALQKAEKHTELAEKRLEEATKLAVNESLNEDTQIYLEQEFGEHVDSSLAAAETLEAEGNPEASLEVRSHLESSLVAHADILDLVEDRLEESGVEDRPVHVSTKNLIRAIKLRQGVVSETRIALERDLEDEATESDTLALVTEAAGSVSINAKESLLPSIIDHVAESGTALAEAKESLERDGADGIHRAFRKAHEAERASEVASVLLENQDILIQVEKTGTTTPEVATTTEPVE